MDYPTTIDRSLNVITSISYRVKLAREIKQMSQIQLSKYVGISQGTLSDLERGKNKSSLMLTKIADVLGVSPIWLLEGKGEMTTGKTNVVQLKDARQEAVAPLQNKVPKIEWSQVSDYILLRGTFNVDENSLISRSLSISEKVFALQVTDDKMEPEFCVGETIIVDPDLSFQTGDYVIVTNGNSGPVFKQIVSEGEDWLLKPVNPRYPITQMTKEQVVVGVVREKLKSYR